MRRARPILGFLCRFVIVYGLLIVPWPGWEETYARLLREGAAFATSASESTGIHAVVPLSNGISVATIFGPLGSQGLVVAFAPNPTGDKTLDTIVFVANRKRTDANGHWLAEQFYFGSRFLAYLPTALVIALVLATGIGWRRRFWALAWGLVCIHVFIAGLLGLMILSAVCAKPELVSFAISPFWRNLVSFLHSLVAENIGTHLAIAVPIWIAVTFRRNDWVNLLGKTPAGDGKPAR